MNPLPILVAGGALLLLKGKKKSKGGSGIVFEDEVITGGLSPATSEGVSFSPDLNSFDIGPMWRIRVLDAWLNEQRLAGRLATVDYGSGVLYTLLVDNPTSWLGDITGLGKTGGAVIYGGLWLMATAGLSVYATGFAAGSANVGAATQAASATRAMQYLGPRAKQIGSLLYKRGFGTTQVGVAMAGFGGSNQMAKFGISKGIVMMSAGAAGLGVSMAAGLLAETGIDAAFSDDIAASTTESAGEFMITHSVDVEGVQIPIALLPSGDEYPAVQEFNKIIMNYIIKFQKRHFED